MTSISPEQLLITWFGGRTAAVESVIFGEPFPVPYDQLASIDGWTTPIGTVEHDSDLPLLPAPAAFLTGDPGVAVATALLVAADYAVRRGAIDEASAATILARESPVAIVIRDGERDVIKPAVAAGVPALTARERVDRDALCESARPFAMRRRAHGVDLGRPHDPAYAFQPRVSEAVIGGNIPSSFVVHNEAARDEIHVRGELGPVVAISIGLPAAEVDLVSTFGMESLIASIPCFLDGVTSWRQGDSLAIGWHQGDHLTPHQLALAFHTWTRALTGIETIDVRLAFSTASERSDLVDQLRRESSRFREIREAAMAGHPDPHTVIEREMIE